ncbi:acid phosphatase [Auriscalpium vulgare]|uniref:Acid phosphatase n=1 Tax=Auriscalpium vulgare TaxID=40419 RepID=A0ACB8SB87_9AGAM|nr:acid phosphatase [Auriscalpium vulgare]
MLFSILSFILYACVHCLHRRNTTTQKEPIPDLGLPEGVLRTWAQYAPYMPVARYPPPPLGCALQRHGARWPTKSAGEDYKAAVDKLQSVEEYHDENLDFLKDFKWDFDSDALLPFGADQSYAAGSAAFDRYSHLVGKENVPFIRTAGSTRVVDSASNWTAGFVGASDNTIKAEVNLVIPESGNITLDDSMCPNAGDGDAESDKWLAIYAPPITARLNAGAPGANLTDDDTHNLMTLCPFHSLIERAASPFCALFTNEEFEAYEYFADINKFYGNGYGQELGPVQGVGYVNELLARLTGQPVQDHTQTNRTLDSSPDTFPLDRSFYADFSHDNAMVGIYSALGLFQEPSPLDPKAPDASRKWIVSDMVPFSARMIVEKVECVQHLPAPRKIFVRLLVDDAIQPLKFCGGSNGMCTLSAFVLSQGYARSDGDGDFEKCFA